MRRLRRSLLLSSFGAAIVAAGLPASLPGQADYRRYFDEDNLPRVYEIFRSGRYDSVIQVCDYALSRGQPSWEWRTLRFEALAKRGRYEEAADEAVATTDLFDGELGALLRAHQLFRSLGMEEQATAMHAAINRAAGAIPARERNALDLVHLAEAALLLGADPAQVLRQYLDVAKASRGTGTQQPPGVVEAHLLAGRIALDKDDYARAAREFREAANLSPQHPEAHYGLARAFLPSDRESANRHLERVFEHAPRHKEALLLKTEQAINFERYDEARTLLATVEEVNPRHPLASAYRAVIAELERNDPEAFAAARDRALSTWRDNPEIDHLIGRVLSRNYRHAEGAEAQQRALEMDPGYLPAKLQLALDYLRLGRVDEAWPLAEAVGEADQYNILAYNLGLLRKEIDSFASIRSEDFIIRMPPHEAEIYGERVLEILTEAKEALEARYGFAIEEPTLVEFYPNQQDFAIRSFGSLGGEGLLGVCFGSVVTMNSPGSLTAGKNNWEATLWHEYAHVVTLTATRNKMPRWLSEGISVYEELERDPAWGQRMTPRYREMILEEEALTPVGEMSGAFFNAATPEHLMFAYYQSMLVVRYLVDEFGFEALREVLKDLADGVLVNDALAARTAPLERLERDFLAYVIDLAETFGPGVDWGKPDPAELDRRDIEAIARYLEERPASFHARSALTERLLSEQRWAEAAESAEALIALLPEHAGHGNGYAYKARAQREMGDLEGESETLERLAALSAEAFNAYTRLLEVDFEREDWAGVILNAQRIKAINPFLDRLHYCRGCAHEALGEREEAVASFEKTLLLGPGNPSEVHYRLAGLVRTDDEERAARHLVDALADSPRFLAAHALLHDLRLGGGSEGVEPPDLEEGLEEARPEAPQVLPPGEEEAAESGGG